MQFSILKTAVATLAICSELALAAPKIVDDLTVLTDMSTDAADLAADINLGSAIFGAPKVINSLRDIVAYGTQALPKWSDVTDTAGADAVLEAYTDFAKVHTHTMETLIGKAGLIQQLGPLTASLAAILRHDEAIVDSMSFSIEQLVPAHAEDFKKMHEPLTDTIAKAVKSYGGDSALGSGGLLGKRSAAFRESLRV